MPVLTVEDHEVVPAGEYPVRIKGYDFACGQFGRQIRWKLELIGSEFEGRRLYFWTPANLTTGNKLGAMLEALGLVLIPGMEIEINTLIGRSTAAVILVGRRKHDGSEFNRVECLKMPRSAESGVEHGALSGG